MFDSDQLPDHARVLDSLLRYFQDASGAIGVFASGSQATGEMDEQSDLDLGVVLDCPESRDSLWSARWEWATEPWFHRFDADHIKAHFVIYLFEPCVKADINFYVVEDLPGWGGAPYELIWSTDDRLEEWCLASNGEARSKRGALPVPDVDLLIHEDERVWAWLVYVALHTKRGEYYSAAWSFPEIRGIVEKWNACLRGEQEFTPRHLEAMLPDASTGQLPSLFPQPTRDSLKGALGNLADLHQEQRGEIGSRLGLTWRVGEESIRRVREIIRDI